MRVWPEGECNNDPGRTESNVLSNGQSECTSTTAFVWARHCPCTSEAEETMMSRTRQRPKAECRMLQHELMVLYWSLCPWKQYFGLGYSPLPMCNHLVGLLFLSLHLLAHIQFNIRPWSGILGCSIEHQFSFLLTGNAGDSHAETPRLGHMGLYPSRTRFVPSFCAS